MSSGFRINSSGDDAAGLATANQYAGTIATLTQGVLNANNAISTLQIADGGISNISTILNRLQTLATESASSTFAGNRTTVNNEYQGLLTEVNRQAASINLNTGGANNTNLVTYVGGGNNSANSQVSVDLSGASSAVDATALGIANTNVAGGGTELTGNNVNLNNTATTFISGNALGTQNFQLQHRDGHGRHGGRRRGEWQPGRYHRAQRGEPVEYAIGNVRHQRFHRDRWDPAVRRQHGIYGDCGSAGGRRHWWRCCNRRDHCHQYGQLHRRQLDRD